MSYLLSTTTTILKTPKFGQLLASCADTPVTASSVCTFTAPANQCYNPYTSGELAIATTSTTNDTLTLGQGHWLLQCYLGFENSNGIANHAFYQFEVAGSAEGTQGASDVTNKTSLDDYAVSIYVAEGSTTNVRLLINSVTYGSGTLQTHDDYTSLLIDYVGLT